MKNKKQKRRNKIIEKISNPISRLKIYSLENMKEGNEKKNLKQRKRERSFCLKIMKQRKRKNSMRNKKKKEKVGKYKIYHR